MAVRHSKTTDIYVGGADLAGDSAGIELILGGQNPETTSLADTGRTHNQGIDEETATFEVLWDDTATVGSDALLAPLLGSEEVISCYPGGDTLGRPGYSHGAFMAESFPIMSSVGEIVRARFSGRANAIAMDRVISLYPKGTAITSTTAGTGYDRGSGVDATDIAVYFYVHVLSNTASGGNAQWTITLQGSSDNGSSDAFANVTSLTVTKANTVIGGFKVSNSSFNLERYVRAYALRDATSGSLIYQAGFAAVAN